MLKNKVVLATGAASGIGRAIALTAAREGALFVAADVGNADECQALVSQAMTHFGRLDVACNNAGIGGVAAPLAAHPIGRLGRAEEVAELVVWLASERASFVTGSYYPADGGYLAR